MLPGHIPYSSHNPRPRLTTPFRYQRHAFPPNWSHPYYAPHYLYTPLWWDPELRKQVFVVPPPPAPAVIVTEKTTTSEGIGSTIAISCCIFGACALIAGIGLLFTAPFVLDEAILLMAVGIGIIVTSSVYLLYDNSRPKEKPREEERGEPVATTLQNANASQAQEGKKAELT